METAPSELQAGYDRVAEEYARRLGSELNHKPLDRDLLARLVERAGGRGTLCDLGCGPGQVAAYLHELGAAAVCGMDLSPEMVRQAQSLHPGILFQAGDMLSLTNVPDESFAGIAAFYVIIHVPRESVGVALREMCRVLMPQGVLLLTFHIGQETRHFDDWWGHPVSIDFHFFEPAPMRKWLQAAGFIVEEIIERDPYPDVEVQTRRAYVFARKFVL